MDSLVLSLNHWKFQTHQTSLPGFILHAVIGTNVLQVFMLNISEGTKHISVSAPNKVITATHVPQKFLSHRKCMLYSIKIRHISLPKYRVSSKLRLQNCYDTTLPEWKSILLSILPLYENNYIPAEMPINKWQIKSFHYFSSRTIPWHSS